MSDRHIELSAKQIERMAQDAVTLAAAVMLFVPISQRRAQKAAARVSRLLLPPIRLKKGKR